MQKREEWQPLNNSKSLSSNRHLSNSKNISNSMSLSKAKLASNKQSPNKLHKSTWISKALILIALVLSLLVNAKSSLALTAKNTLIIESLDLNYEPLYGFAYRIYNNKTGELVCEVDLRNNYRQEIELKDGEYYIREIKRPTNYIVMPDKLIKFPYYVKEGQISRKLTFYPKHKLEVGTPQPHTKVGKTGELMDDNEEVMRYGLALIAISISLYVLYKEFSKEADLEAAYVEADTEAACVEADTEAACVEADTETACVEAGVVTEDTVTETFTAEENIETSSIEASGIEAAHTAETVTAEATTEEAYVAEASTVDTDTAAN